jgi:uncharacterized protein YegP (UPF0339 family)
MNTMDQKNFYKLIFLLLALIGGVGCKDFIEPSLENRTVVLKAPADGSESNKYQVGFWWDPVEDALFYRLQIVTPDFGAPVSLVRDTLVEGRNKIEMTLEPGKYQWRVRAENGSSVSKYVSSGFIIHESALTEQRVTLIAPGSGYLSSAAGVSLSWNKLFGATEYLLQIDTENFQDETKLVYNQVISGDTYLFNFPKDGVYQWRVRAQNEKETSKWSETRIMTSDKTPPGIPAPQAPVKGAQVAQPVSITWSAVATAKKYKLYLYKSDGVTGYTGSPFTLNTNSYAFSLAQPGELVYWKVLAVDEIGNEGTAAELMNFSIQ